MAPAHEPLSQDNIPNSSNSPLTYMDVFMRVYLFAFTVAEIQAKKKTCYGERSALCFIPDTSSLDLMISNRSHFFNDELFFAFFVRPVLR